MAKTQSQYGQPANYNLTPNVRTDGDACAFEQNKYGSTLMSLKGNDNDSLKITATGYAAVSLESLEFFDTVDGTNLNTNLWNTSVSTMTVTQAGGFINVNPTNSTVASKYSILSSIQTFFLTSCLPLHIHLDLNSSAWNIGAHTTMEYGWMTCATNAAPTDGVFIRATGGTALLVANNGGTETTSAFTLPAANTTNEYVLDIYADSARLYIDGVLATSVTRPATQPALTSNSRQPITFRVYTDSTGGDVSPTANIGQVSVQQRNAQFNKPYSNKMIGFGRSAIQNPVSTFTQLANYANSAAPASATLANATAGYTNLGGQWQFAAVNGAETDYALFGYQVPAGYQLYISDIRIVTYNTGAIGSAVTPTILQWGVAVNSSNVSLATTDGAGTWAPRRMTIGSQALGLSAIIGANTTDIVWSPQVPLLTEGGRFFHVILKMPLGVNTASQVIRGTVSLSGYFE